MSSVARACIVSFGLLAGLACCSHSANLTLTAIREPAGVVQPIWQAFGYSDVVAIPPCKSLSTSRMVVATGRSTVIRDLALTMGLHVVEHGQSHRVDFELNAGALPAQLSTIEDITGDDCVDLCIGLPGANAGSGSGQVVVIASAGLEPLFTLRSSIGSSDFGAFVVPVADCNGDGIADVAIGAMGRPDRGWPGEISVHSGAGGQVLWSRGLERFERLGCLSGISDTDDDRVRDLLIGIARPAERPGIDESPIWLVLSGRSGSPVGTCRSGVPGYSPISAGRLSDVDRDSQQDYYALEEARNPVSVSSCVIRLVSGVSGATLAQRELQVPGSNWLTPCGTIRDRDGDGADDVLVCTSSRIRPGDPWSVDLKVLSGRDLALLASWDLDGPKGRVEAIVPIEDTDGDGEQDIALIFRNDVNSVAEWYDAVAILSSRELRM